MRGRQSFSSEDELLEWPTGAAVPASSSLKYSTPA